jgi:hypothetical protein
MHICTVVSICQYPEEWGNLPTDVGGGCGICAGPGARRLEEKAFKLNLDPDQQARRRLLQVDLYFGLKTILRVHPPRVRPCRLFFNFGISLLFTKK